LRIRITTDVGPEMMPLQNVAAKINRLYKLPTSGVEKTANAKEWY